MTQPTLLLCIGATKAGTSWLHRYVSDHPQCHMRAVKEMHYFDAVGFDNFEPWIRDLRNTRAQKLNGLKPGLSARARANMLRVADDATEWAQVLERRRRDDAAYLAFLDQGRTDQRLVGDFTPAYGLLGADWLAIMAAFRPDVRFIYLLRDPIDRAWSHCRMMAQRRATDRSDGAEVQARSVNIVKRLLKGKEPEIERRCDYAGTLERLRAAVPAERRYVGFYEDLFSEAEVGRICRFLGIDPAPADFDRRILKGPQARMEPDQPDKLRAHLAPQYDFIFKTFDRVPSRWVANAEKVG